jgi:hypothetical protein
VASQRTDAQGQNLPSANLDLALIFSIRDDVSAWLMSLKADCLCRAGVIAEEERLQVYAKAARRGTSGPPKQLDSFDRV